MIKYIFSIVILLCFTSIGMAFFSDVNYEEKITIPPIDLDINIEDDKVIYSIIIDDIFYSSTGEFDIKKYHIYNLSINQSQNNRIIKNENIIKEIDKFSFSFNDKINKTINNTITVINVEIKIDGRTIIKLNNGVKND